MKSLLALLFLVAAVQVCAVDIEAVPEALTPENYDEKTAGKTIFVKFYSPKCILCRDMSPVWETLAKMIGNDGHALIAAVDCLNENNAEICRRNEITQLPAVKWGDPQNLEFYTGTAEYEELYRFARKHLKPFCSANLSRRHLCSDQQNKTIAEYEDFLSDGKLDEMILDLENKIVDARNTFVVETTKLNDLANDLNDAKNVIVQPSEISLQLMNSEKGRRHRIQTFAKYSKDDSGAYVLAEEKMISKEEKIKSNDKMEDEL